MEKLWENEPNELNFESHGFKCELRRNYSGAWCGYVILPMSHPQAGKDYESVEFGYEDSNPHGGLTYGRPCADGWKVGFDCAHFGDLTPEMANNGRELGEYRDVGFAIRETVKMAKGFS
jgi:hypothetical protein